MTFSWVVGATRARTSQPAVLPMHEHSLLQRLLACLLSCLLPLSLSPHTLGTHTNARTITMSLLPPPCQHCTQPPLQSPNHCCCAATQTDPSNAERCMSCTHSCSKLWLSPTHTAPASQRNTTHTPPWMHQHRSTWLHASLDVAVHAVLALCCLVGGVHALEKQEACLGVRTQHSTAQQRQQQQRQHQQQLSAAAGVSGGKGAAAGWLRSAARAITA